jgi:hypothetical protein
MSFLLCYDNSSIPNKVQSLLFKHFALLTCPRKGYMPMSHSTNSQRCLEDMEARNSSFIYFRRYKERRHNLYAFMGGNIL